MQSALQTVELTTQYPCDLETFFLFNALFYRLESQLNEIYWSLHVDKVDLGLNTNSHFLSP